MWNSPGKGEHYPDKMGSFIDIVQNEPAVINAIAPLNQFPGYTTELAQMAGPGDCLLSDEQ